MIERNITCKTRPVQRARGQSAAAGAAYRSAERLYCTQKECWVDYSNRKADVWHTEILAPDGAPDWVFSRQNLHARIEAMETRRDGRPGRDVVLGCVWELAPDDQRAMVLDWVKREFVAKGHIADVSFHKYGHRVVDSSEEGRETLRRWAKHNLPFVEAEECAELWDPHVKIERSDDGTVRGFKVFQPHAHAFISPRALEGDEFAAKRNREFDRAEQAKEWRYEWPKHQNAWLEAAGIDVRVSATATDHPEHLPYLPETVSQTAYHIEQRGEVSYERETAELNAIHNETVRQADEDVAVSEESGEGGRFARVRAWWQQMRGHFSEWRDHLWERFGRAPEPEPDQEEVPTQEEPPPQEGSDAQER